ncbi:type II toxin-antitoxin system HicB family antitoxin [Natrialbaceae archaeon AArc-T1-2]|uniref:type II toxin-antitoxin system HicB family antitoxin n=1 Tax=Natrialbaceae archaeon AArc-T1-2 TaxID=3053904 RepID=UPI00255A7995|nr:type II toxin-antitoxin system HicB family antitoxin [Natrialbaceae archaeon AArc-T1-2]WIV66290.1 type II toxin-antitoxin system HicB family antitoxin [Natrialbaceae archaeon AArc-T1-2]
MGTDSRDDVERDPDGSITVTEEDSITVTDEGGFYVAKDEETGVSSQGETRADAIERLERALEVYVESIDEDGDDWL